MHAIEGTRGQRLNEATLKTLGCPSCSRTFAVQNAQVGAVRQASNPPVCNTGYDNASWDGAAMADVLQWAMRTSMLCGGQALTHPAEDLLLLSTSRSSSSSNPESPFLFNDSGLLIVMGTLRTVWLKT